MAANKHEDWRELQVGDRIRFVAMPSQFAEPGYFVHPSTERVYRRLIERYRPVRVFKIDAWRIPWIRCQFRAQDGRWEHHNLAIDHDGWVRVEAE